MPITLILGPMFSGKTTELIRLGHRSALAGKRVVYVKHESDLKRWAPDDPSAGDVRAHDDKAMVGRPALVARDLGVLLTRLVEEEQAQVVCIDEGQFFTDLRSMVLLLVNCHGMEVIVAALNATYNQEMFPSVNDLLPVANQVQWLHAVCFKCGSQQATYTHRREQV